MTGRPSPPRSRKRAAAGPGSEGLTTEPSHQDRERSGTQRTDRRCYHVRISSLSKPSPGRRCSLGPPCKLAGPACCPRSAKPTVAYSPQAERATGVLLPYFRKLRDLHVKSLSALSAPHCAPCAPHRMARASGRSCPSTLRAHSHWRAPALTLPPGRLTRSALTQKRWLSSNA